MFHQIDLFEDTGRFLLLDHMQEFERQVDKRSVRSVDWDCVTALVVSNHSTSISAAEWPNEMQTLPLSISTIDAFWKREYSVDLTSQGGVHFAPGGPRHIALCKRHCMRVWNSFLSRCEKSFAPQEVLHPNFVEMTHREASVCSNTKRSRTTPAAASTALATK